MTCSVQQLASITILLKKMKFVASISKNEMSCSSGAFCKNSSVISNKTCESFLRLLKSFLAGFRGEQAATILAMIFPHVAMLLPWWGVPEILVSKRNTTEGMKM